MCGEPPKRILPVPLQFEGQILPKRLVRHREPAHVHKTKWPLLLVMPTDFADTVETTHVILAQLKPTLQYVHIPAPKRRDDDAYYPPLDALCLPEDCDLYLGVIHHDDREVDRRRIAAAARTVPDFGIAIEWGSGRADPGRAPGHLASQRVALEGQ